MRVDAGGDRECGDAAVPAHQAVELEALLLRLVERLADDGESPGQNLDMVGVAADLGGPSLHVGVEGAAGLNRPARSKHHLRRLGSKLATGIRGAGLHHHRPALDRPRDVQGAAHLQVLALVVQHMELVGIEIESALDIADKGIVRP